MILIIKMLKISESTSTRKSQVNRQEAVVRIFNYLSENKGFNIFEIADKSP